MSDEDAIKESNERIGRRAMYGDAVNVEENEVGPPEDALMQAQMERAAHEAQRIDVQMEELSHKRREVCEVIYKTSEALQERIARARQITEGPSENKNPSW